MKGTVKFFNNSKGYGFIAGEDGKEYFVHLSGLNEGVRIADNDAVLFDVEDGERGPKAVNVSRDDGSADDAANVPNEETEEETQSSEDDSSEETNDSSEEDSDDDSADDDSEDDKEDKN